MKASMYPQFGQLMKDATAHTRAGDLDAAMAALRQALQHTADAAAPAAQNADLVIDIDARVVDSDAPPQPTAGQAQHAPAQFVSGHFVHRAGARDYRLFTPSARAEPPRALVLMLHGCTQDPDDFARGTRMNALAEVHNVVVLYPAQSRQMNAQGCWNWFKHNHQRRDKGEPAILADMARQIAHRQGVDPAQVYVAGLSAGGAMAAILATTYPDVFAAAGVHSGLPAGAARDLPGALAAMQGNGQRATVAASPSTRVIVFHGDADATVHPSNADHVADTHRAGTASRQETLDSGGRRCTRRVHKDGNGRVVTEQWVIHGAGHAWSGANAAGSYADAKGPDASAEMLRFFFS
ncbi:MAG: extracellular catalytic domain type 1 short-chain-length polyhydroxyalkanoate depolymerase [Roseateles sp.]